MCLIVAFLDEVVMKSEAVERRKQENEHQHNKQSNMENEALLQQAVNSIL